MKDKIKISTSFDVLASIFAKFKVREIRCEDCVIHNSIYKVIKNNKFIKFFPGLVFEDHAYYFYCRELQADMDNMRLCDLIEPFYKGFVVTDALVEFVCKNDCSIFSQDEIKEIHQMAEEISKEISESCKIF